MAIQLEKCNSLFDVLEEIRKRPDMFLGSDGYDDQLRNLEMIFIGYELALSAHQIDEAGKKFHVKFSAFLRETYSWSLCCGAISAIRAHSKDGEEVWNKFWELLDEFKNSLSLKKTSATSR